MVAFDQGRQADGALEASWGVQGGRGVWELDDDKGQGGGLGFGRFRGTA